MKLALATTAAVIFASAAAAMTPIVPDTPFQPFAQPGAERSVGAQAQISLDAYNLDGRSKAQFGQDTVALSVFEGSAQTSNSYDVR